MTDARVTPRFPVVQMRFDRVVWQGVGLIYWFSVAYMSLFTNANDTVQSLLCYIRLVRCGNILNVGYNVFEI